MKRLAFALLALTSLVPTVADAQLPPAAAPPKWWETPRQPGESPQRFAFELKLGPYTPHLDSSPGLNGATPFQDLFTNQFTTPRPSVSPGVLTQLEFDWQFLRKFGSLGVGVTIGIYRKTTHAFQYSDPIGMTSCTVGNCIRSGDETALTIVPMSLLLVYRFDWLARRYRVPLVPYFKIGLAYYAWFVQNGAGGIPTIKASDGKSYDGYGGTFGWVLNPGLAFLLDIIDPRTARVMDAETGINHTYLFCELHYADVSGFGQSNRMVLSDTTLNAGLAFEF